MFDKKGMIFNFVNVAFRKQTYLNILYLLFTFPLGTAYFIFLVSSISVGFSLLVAWIGIPILILVFLSWWEIASFERQLAIWLLGVEIPPMSLEKTPGKNILEKGLARIKNPVTWKALLFLCLKFPLGILSLIVTVFLMSLTGAMLLSPLSYHSEHISFVIFNMDTPDKAIETFVLGVLVGFASLHTMNYLAKVAGIFAVLMLGVSKDHNRQVSEKEV